MTIRFVLAATVALTTISATAVLAQSDPIAARKALMKSVGAQTGIAAKMAKGDEPFDLARAKKVFETYHAASGQMPSLYPDNSRTGGDTTASPRIWEDMPEFEARFVRFGEDAKAAGASVSDLESFKASFGAVTRNCSGCHEVFRVKKS